MLVILQTLPGEIPVEAVLAYLCEDMLVNGDFVFSDNQSWYNVFFVELVEILGANFFKIESLRIASQKSL